MNKDNINIEDMDIEAQIKDVEGLLDALKDIVSDTGLTIKATMSASLKNIGSYSILLKRNQNRLKELLTRYEFDKIKHVPVGTLLGEFLEGDLPIASEVDILEKVLTLTSEDFNLDVLDLLTTTKKDKTIDGLINSNIELDKVGKNLILAGVVDVDDELRDSIRSGDIGYITSYVFGRNIKGILVDSNKSNIYSKRLKFSRTPTLPKLIPLSLFNTVKDNFLEHNDNDFKAIIALYRRAIKDTGKYLRIASKDDGLTASEARLLTESVVYHLDYVADSLSKLTSIQYDFLHVCLRELESVVIGGTSRGTL